MSQLGHNGKVQPGPKIDDGLIFIAVSTIEMGQYRDALVCCNTQYWCVSVLQISMHALIDVSLCIDQLNVYVIQKVFEMTLMFC